MLYCLQGAGHASAEESDVSQRQLELQYSRVVQAAFLYSRVKLLLLLAETRMKTAQFIYILYKFNSTN